MGSFRQLAGSWCSTRSMPAGAGIASISFRPILARRENAAEVLLKGDAGFFRDARGIGINRVEKILDFLLNLHWNDMAVRTSWWGDFPWLDLRLHFRLYPYHFQTTSA